MEVGPPQPFIGHVGGDDFVALCTPEQVEPFCTQCVQIFDDRVRALHDPIDAERGFISVLDRQGNERRWPLTSLSIGVATTTRRQFTDPRSIVAVASEMKGVAKATTGSAVAIDRRSGPVDGDQPEQ
jgi:hypothetical protein